MLNSEKQKVATLIGLAVVTAVYSYFNYLLSPLWAEQKTLNSQLANSIQTTDSESSELKRLQAAERADLVNQPLDRLVERMTATIPTNPIISCYDIFTSSFSGPSLQKGKTLLFSQSRFRAPAANSEITIPDYMLYTWNIYLSKVKLIPLGKAIADFETKYPLTQIVEVSLSPGDQTSEKAKLEVDMPVKP
jgi:hypothetical protein